MAKLSAHPQTPRAILNVYAYLLSSASPISLPNEAVNSQPDPETYFLSDGTYYKQRTMLMQTEARILRVLGFSVHVALPYTLAINYLQALDVYSDTRSAAPLSQRVFSYLNTALISPQLLFLTHQPSALATAAIYLAARELKVKLPTEEWWEVFDVDREELGFLVVGMRSTEGFVRAERERWRKKIVPLSVDDVEAEIERRTMLETGV
ncbi:MAG: hypothetical protein M1825_005118 [Sarcosagium campestre]|nr:MAG: hypothetical protein M1825_005118 [Sarcosagium campestre]